MSVARQPEDRTASPSPAVAGEGRPLLAAALTGLAVCIVGAGGFLRLETSTDRVAEGVLKLNAEVAEHVLLAESSLQNYLATGEEHYRSQYEAARDALGGSMRDLRRAGAALALPDDVVANGVDSLEKSLGAWSAKYAEPAIGLKHAAGGRQPAKLTSLNKRGVGASRADEIGAQLNFLKGRVEGALVTYRARAMTRERIWLSTAALGLAAFLGTGLAWQRQRQRMFDALRRRSARLGALAEYAERIHHMTKTDQAARLLASEVGRRAGSAAVLLRSEDGLGMRIAAALGPVRPEADRSPLLADFTVCPVMRSGHRFMIRDVAWGPVCDCPVGAPVEGGYVCVPLLAQGRTTGLVNWKTARGIPPHPEDIDHAEELARVTSLALSTLVSLDSAKHEAVTDQLTGVANRRFLDSYVAKQVPALLRQNRPLAVLMLDLDRFKAFNDRHGHQAGDALLKAAAEAVTAHLREGDVVARYGGEEFTVVLPDATREAAGEIAERIRRAVETIRLDGLPGLPSPVSTISIGLAVAPEDGRAAGALLQAADAALYRAKEAGRNRVVSAGPA